MIYTSINRQRQKKYTLQTTDVNRATFYFAAPRRLTRGVDLRTCSSGNLDLRSLVVSR